MRDIFFLPIFLFQQLLPAQTEQADSLKLLLPSATNDTQQVHLYLKIGEAYHDIYYGDSALYYARLATRSARTAGRGDLEALGVHLLARGHHVRGAYAEAIERYAEAGALYRRHNVDYNAFLLQMNLSICNTALGRSAAAIAHLDTAEMHIPPDSVRFQMLHASYLGVVLGDQNRHREALKYQHRALSFATADTKPQDLLPILFRIANLQMSLHAPDSALHYLNLALPLAIQSKNYYMEWHIRGNIGMHLVSRGAYADGIAAFQEAEKLEDRVGNNICCGNGAYQALALYKLGRGAEAGTYLAQAEAYPPLTPIESMQTLPALLEVYEMQGNHKKALETFRLLKTAEDTLARQEYQLHIADLEVRYRSQEQAAALAEQQARLTRQRIYILVVLVIAGLLGVLAFLYHRVGRIRKQAAAAVEQKNKLLTALDATKSRFFANISHEFRTPLTLILAPLSTVSAALRDRNLRKQVDMARRSAEHLLRLVEELLELSKLEAGKLALREQAFRPVGWLRQHLHAFDSQAVSKRVKLRMETAVSENLEIVADADKVEKIVNNLIANAIKYGKTGGTVTLAAHWAAAAEDKGTFTVSVADDGPGIPPDDLPHIFERYYQGGGTSAAPVGGVGLGLALAHELAQLMGGTLGVHSMPGQGAVFTLTLPAAGVLTLATEVALVAETETRSAAPVPAPFKPQLERPPQSVLVVEDNTDMRTFLEQVLAPHFTVVSAEDGAAALRCLERRHFDLVLSDVMMPNMDGFTLLEQVRRHPTTFRHTPFVFLTARALDDDQLLGLRLGVDDYLLKPFQPDFLVARLQNLLHNHAARQKRRGDTAEPDSAELALVKTAEQTVLARIDDPAMKIEDLAKALNQSPRNLERVLKRLTGFTPVEFMRELRLQRAFQLLQQNRYRSVSEARLAVGIENGAYFSRIFQKRFGLPPGEVLRGGG